MRHTSRRRELLPAGIETLSKALDRLASDQPRDCAEGEGDRAYVGGLRVGTSSSPGADITRSGMTSKSEEQFVVTRHS